jgi:hypothetical protein
MTGCLRISKESIFTGLNNLEIITILDRKYGEYFGFIQPEVCEMLEYYGVTARQEEIRRWYNGYRFGNVDVYNPWSIIKAVKGLWINPDEFLRPFWGNTSSNSIVKTLIEQADAVTKTEIESLLAGESIEKPIHEEITYGDMGESRDNLWNFLFFTGYLTQAGSRMEDIDVFVSMKIPNLEVQYIYKQTIMQWFQGRIGQKDLHVFYDALFEGDTDIMERELSDILMQTISYHDYAEDYYPGFMAGLVRNIKDVVVYSNRESGLGRPDLLIMPERSGAAILIIELKVSKTYAGMEAKCREGLAQIIDRQYEEGLRADGFKNFVHYCVAFYKKGCLVRKGPA